MTSLQATATLYLAAVVVYANPTSPGPETSDEKTQVYVGIQVIYDRDIYRNITDTRFLNQGEYKPSPSDYFAAFVSGVQLRFRDITDFAINMTLVNATLINDDDLWRINNQAPEYGDALDGEKTMVQLRLEMQNNNQKYGRGDMVFYVTTKYVYTKQNEEKEWLGVAKSKGFCSPEDKVGIVTDDGKSFSGIESMAVQAALLLGATSDEKTEECKNDRYLLSNLHGARGNNLSPCSKKDIPKFLKEGFNSSQKKCWERKEPITVTSPEILPSEYHTYFGYDICLRGYSGTRGDVRTCEPKYETKRTVKPCRVQCCEYAPRRGGDPYFLTTREAADGTRCNTSNICIGGDCVKI